MMCSLEENSGVYEGTCVRKGAVLGAGVILTRSTPVYDLVNGCTITASAEQPLQIPEGAVVVTWFQKNKRLFCRRKWIGLSMLR